ncbi:hypothetical protein L6164_009676 [Bauhinia variegata]|uniref:Uncharacterized protein n=1 Tax=Bauhinia variegata TaxID=167791 RepID=A0ACB9PND8_BAUVA|nr:hypothetical protein L6164_009676 [Bauhinia variegata]
MEAGEIVKEEQQKQIPWIPTTPLKPIRSRPVPICGSEERNQLNQTDFLEASSCCNSSHDCHASRVSACSESAPGAEINSRLHDWEAPAAAGTNIDDKNSGTYPQLRHNPMSRWANTGCTELLALANAASAHFTATHPDNVGVKSLTSESLLNRGPVANLSSVFTHHDLSQQTDTETIHVNPQQPQRTASVGFCSKTISQLAPPTPDKAIRAECRELAGRQLNMEERAEREMNNAPATKLDNKGTSQNQDISDSVSEISFAAVSMPLKENHNPQRGESEVTELNKTPQQKPRRKKHRPKVISEGKPRRTKRPVTPKPAQSEKNTGKRKYVRRKGLNDTSVTPPSEMIGQSIESTKLESNKKSCRRALNFEIGEQPIDENSACNENGATMRLGNGVSLPEDLQSPGESTPKNYSLGASHATNSGKRKSKRKSQVMLSPNESSSNIAGTLTTGLQKDCSKRKHSTTIEHTDTSSTNLIGARYNGLQAYQEVCVQFPNIQKKRNGRGQTSKISTLTALEERTRDGRDRTYASSSSSWTIGSEYYAAQVPVTFEATVHRETQSFQDFLSLIQNSTRPAKRQSKVPAQANHSTKQLGNDDKQTIENVEKSTCNDALGVETMEPLMKKKQTKKKSTLVNSEYSSNKATQLYQNPVLVNSLNANGKKSRKNMQTMEALGEQFRHLDINKEGSDFVCEEQNALVLYNTQIQEHDALVHAGGTIIPFNSSFDSIRKRPRPKVDLDDETNRVWELLLANINNDGIDGKDKDTAKWWEEERSVFRGRADSFVARMRLVQGDRRFSAWKGSVVDSVVGVFLTQNVSDHLSSSAFISLAAKFPLKPPSNCKRHSEEGTSLVVKEPEMLTVEPEENRQWDGKILNRSIYDDNSMTIDIIERSEEKAINSNSTGTITEEGQEKSDYEEPGKESNDVVSSQSSVISSQMSGDFTIEQNPEKLWSCTDSNSEVEELSSTAKYNLFDNSTSFSKLLQLQMANSTMLHEVTSQRIGSSDNLKRAYVQSTGMKHDNQTENLEKSDLIQDSVASMSPSSECTLKVTNNSGVLEVHCFDHFKTEASSSGLSNNKDEHNMNKPSSHIIESRNQVTTAHSQSTIYPLHLKEQNNDMQQSLLNSSGQTQDLMQKATESDSRNHNPAVRNGTKEMSATTIKSKGRRLGKQKKENFNWDSLRIEAEAGAEKKERTVNNMDSLDWDAVRCADVNEIAEAIKERGMNNMLADRIKNFLNRLVEDHGSIDLEWLRDVQPDQAKEFLLSIRGLGLKSVECVRLLTLHHLAFPVDTNVGRIAVRLGWVPLQPLPESLQLHLLELYPVLESIQKYLWPRLCKLDQNTLYELHYQMITFGKVFCTKSKPNCNACPMRGECRHFASAFASARLALPGPEQRSIVSMAGDSAIDQNPSIVTSLLPLPLPEYAKQPEEIQQTEVCGQLDAKSGINICQPIIEEPATPEPECTQISEKDIEDSFCEDRCEIPTIKLNFEEFTLNLQNFMQHNMEIQEGEMSKALVALDPEAASIPMPKLKNVSRLRTEHCIYELPDDHALLEGWDKREPDDPCSYLLAIWTPGETANSIQPPESKCSSQEYGKLCNDKECFSCNSVREANMQIVRGTILIPCRTAMRGRFPLNGTYFQVNEVFADHDSSLNPINVPRGLIWTLRRRTVYFGTSIPTIFKGLSTQEIQHCFWRGHVCVRGFDRKTRAPRPLMARLHFPASKLAKNKEKTDSN